MKSWYEITARWVAMGRGDLRYYTGQRCRRQHLGQRRTSDGSCIECANLRHRTRYHTKDAEKLRARSRAWREANIERANERTRKWREVNAERMRFLSKRYWRENKARLGLEAKKWLNNNPGKRREYQKRWEKKYPGATSLYTMRRVARKRGAEGFHTLKDIRAILEQQQYTCAYERHGFSWCRKWFDKYNVPHIDHIVALSKGGADHVGNLQALCGPCNIRKFNRDERAFLQAHGVAA